MALLPIQIILVVVMLVSLYRKVRQAETVRSVEVLFIAMFFLATWS
jgi:hypothetical protein